MNSVDSMMVKANGMIQKDQLLSLGIAISGAPIIIGIIQFANPTNAGMTTPKIITMACMVVIELKNIGSTIWIPGWNNSARITSAIAPPIKNMIRENHKYKVPMSL